MRFIFIEAPYYPKKPVGKTLNIEGRAADLPSLTLVSLRVEISAFKLGPSTEHIRVSNTWWSLPRGPHNKNHRIWGFMLGPLAA